VLLYPGGFSETEILLPYGGTSFSSIVRPLARNHFLTVVDNLENLRTIGEHVLSNGATRVIFKAADDAATRTQIATSTERDGSRQRGRRGYRHTASQPSAPR
jgi:hypothetical protein